MRSFVPTVVITFHWSHSVEERAGGAGGAGETDRRSDPTGTGRPKVPGSLLGCWITTVTSVTLGVGARRARCTGERPDDSALTQGLNYSQNFDLRPKWGKTEPAFVMAGSAAPMFAR